MSLAFAHSVASETPLRLAAALAGPRRPKSNPAPRDWLKVAHRLAAGPGATARPEGGDEPLVRRLLEREEFRALVEGVKSRLAEPPESRKRRLVGLAQQALERALLLDDAGAALFVLEEDARDCDPAVTLADGVLRAEARALMQAPPRAAPAPTRPDERVGFGYAPATTRCGPSCTAAPPACATPYGSRTRFATPPSLRPSLRRKLPSPGGPGS